MSNTSTSSTYPKAVQIWLILGVILIIGQVLIGGITRLTGSGLSITEWDIIKGTIPPLNEETWMEKFDLYKETPQYEKINVGMTLSEFKFIYFWEYFHRLWARSMGFIFLIPFIIFWRKKWIDKPLMKRLGITVLLAAVVASFGWIMVASGLIERPWVNAYKLTMHLSLACLLYAYFLWTVFTVFYPQKESFPQQMLKSPLFWVTLLTVLQIILGGIVAGTKAALNYPTWPDMNGQFIPDVLLNPAMWTVDNFVNYDASPFFSAFIQFVHRAIAYALTISGLYFVYKSTKVQISGLFKKGVVLFSALLITQVLLGILTLIYSKGSIPVALGVGHQAGALFLLSVVLFLNYHLSAYKKD